MVFFIAQSALVRVRNIRVHRSLGWLGAGLATVMVVLGLVITVVMGRFDTGVLHEKDIDAVPVHSDSDMIAFGACIALAIYWRKKPEYHRRLVFIGTCVLMDAPLGRYRLPAESLLVLLRDLDGLIALGMLRDWIVDRSGTQSVLVCAAAVDRSAGLRDVHVADQSAVVASDDASDYEYCRSGLDGGKFSRASARNPSDSR